jgi:hypothetical protein
MNWNDLISEMQYPHWLMAAGGVLVAVGFFGFAFRKSNEPAVEQAVAPPEGRSHLRPLPTRRLPPPPPFLLDPRD